MGKKSKILVPMQSVGTSKYSNNEMLFSIPYNGDAVLLERIEKYNLLSKINDIYFAGNPLILPSGRRPKILNFIKLNNGKYIFNDIEYEKDILGLIEFCRKNNISRNLLVNFSGKLNAVQINYIDNLINCGVDVLTVGNQDIFNQVAALWQNVKIQNSVYFQLADATEIEYLFKKGLSIFLIPPDFNHSMNEIRSIKALADKFNVKLKIMVNEGCIIGCVHRGKDQNDAESYSVQQAILDYITNPNEIRLLKQPCRLYMNVNGIGSTNFIHPDEIDKIACFDPILKIVGRSFDINRIIKTINAYIDMRYEGDFREIVENFKHSIRPLFLTETSKPFFIQ